MVYKVIKHKNKKVLAYKEPWMQVNGRNKICTIFFDVSFFVGNPVESLQYEV